MVLFEFKNSLVYRGPEQPWRYRETLSQKEQQQTNKNQ